MSELTDSVRKMLSQAQVFARDTPFEAVSRARQATKLVEGALGSASTPDEKGRLENLLKLAAKRAAKYEADLEAWLGASRGRGEAFTQRERDVIGLPLRTQSRD
jgi:hypothetical protein